MLEVLVLMISDVLPSTWTSTEIFSSSSILSLENFLNHCLTLLRGHDLDLLVSIFPSLLNLIENSEFLGPISGHEYFLVHFSFVVKFPKPKSIEFSNNPIS